MSPCTNICASNSNSSFSWYAIVIPVVVSLFIIIATIVIITVCCVRRRRLMLLRMQQGVHNSDVHSLHTRTSEIRPSPPFSCDTTKCHWICCPCVRRSNDAVPAGVGRPSWRGFWRRRERVREWRRTVYGTPSPVSAGLLTSIAYCNWLSISSSAMENKLTSTTDCHRTLLHSSGYCKRRIP